MCRKSAGFYTIGRRRLTAIVTILCKNSFKMCDPLLKIFNRLLQSIEKSECSINAFIVNLAKLFFGKFGYHRDVWLMQKPIALINHN